MARVGGRMGAIAPSRVPGSPGLANPQSSFTNWPSIAGAVLQACQDGDRDRHRELAWHGVPAAVAPAPYPLAHLRPPLCAMAQDDPPTPSAVAAVAEPSPLPRDTGAPRGQARPALAWHNGCSVRVLETDGASAARAGHACLGPLTSPGQRHPVHGIKSTPSWTGTEECPHADTGAQQEGCSQQRDLMDGDMGTGSAMPSCQETATKCSYVPSIALS